MQTHKRKGLVAFAATVLIVLAAFIAVPAIAADIVLEAEITGRTDAIDRNGNPYTRFIISEDREMAGIKYQAGVPTMAFGEMKEKTGHLVVGDTLHAVVSAREFSGRTSYTIQALVD